MYLIGLESNGMEATFKLFYPQHYKAKPGDLEFFKPPPPKKKTKFPYSWKL